MTDDEGGGVWRLGNLVAPLPWARDMASWSPARITSTVKTSALALHRLGITMDLAPVLDLDGRMVVPSKSDPDGLRSFGASASLVSTDGAAYMAGLTVGFWSDPDELSAHLKLGRRFEPSMDVARREELYAGWLCAVERTKSNSSGTVDSGYDV